MQKLFRIFTLAMVLTVFMAGGAWAASSTLDIHAGVVGGAVGADADVDGTATGAYVVGSEWLAGQAGAVTVDLGNAVPTPGAAAAARSQIIYIPGISLGIGNTIVLTVTNGALAASASYGIYDETLTKSCATLVDFTSDASGYTRLVFKFIDTRGSTFPSVDVNDILYITENGLAPAAGNQPTLKFTNAQLTAGNMTLKITEAYDSTAQPLEAPLTATAETVAKKADQLSAKVQYLTGVATYADGAATSVINVEATPLSRSLFVAEAAKDTPTTTTSTAALLVASATVNNGINVAAASYTITLNGDQAAIRATTGVTLGGTNFTRNAGISWTLTSTFAAHDLTTAGANDILITVSGTSIINTANYTVTLVIDPAEAGVANKTSLDGATAFIWTVNAMQARIPYLVVDTSAAAVYSSFLEITNRGSQDAKVSFDAIISNSDATTNVAETKNDALTVPAGSCVIVRQADLDTYFTAIDNTKLYRVALLLTVVAPQNTVDVTAFHLSPEGGRTSAPVLYNTNNLNDGRLWQ